MPKLLAISLLLSTNLNSCFGTQTPSPSNQSPSQVEAPSAPAPANLSPAAICRGQYTPTYRTTWIPAAGSQIPEYEGSCVVAAGVRG